MTHSLALKTVNAVADLLADPATAPTGPGDASLHRQHLAYGGRPASPCCASNEPPPAWGHGSGPTTGSPQPPASRSPVAPPATPSTARLPSHTPWPAPPITCPAPMSGPGTP